MFDFILISENDMKSLMDTLNMPACYKHVTPLMFVDSFLSFKHVPIETHGIYPWLSVVVLDLLGISMEFP